MALRSLNLSLGTFSLPIFGCEGIGIVYSEISSYCDKKESAVISLSKSLSIAGVVVLSILETEILD